MTIAISLTTISPYHDYRYLPPFTPLLSYSSNPSMFRPLTPSLPHPLLLLPRDYLGPSSRLPCSPSPSRPRSPRRSRQCRVLLRRKIEATPAAASCPASECRGWTSCSWRRGGRGWQICCCFHPEGLLVSWLVSFWLLRPEVTAVREEARAVRA